MVNRRLAILTLATLLGAASAAGAAEALKPFKQDIPGTAVSFEMVPVPAGEVTIADASSPGATRTVKLRPFWIGKTEVTWDEYDAFAIWKHEEGKPAGAADAVLRPSRPYGAPDRGFGRKGYPAISVSAYAAENYCKWLSALTGRKYRLPTEAEWEYACLAGRPAPAGAELEKAAWFWQEKTQPVGKKLPNAWGIHDMLGNVAEWAVDLAGKPVACGGSWQDLEKKVKPSARAYQTPDWQATDPQNPKGKWWLSDAPFVGFRVVCEP